jgi:gluconokinase
MSRSERELVEVDPTRSADLHTRETPLALAVDIGTSSTRAFVYDRLGHSLGGARIRYTWRTTPDGGVEVDADHLVDWTLEAIDGALEQVGDRRVEIAAVGVSTLWHSLVGVGANGSAVTPLYAWSDTRATAAATELRSRLDEAAVHARTGAVFHPAYLPARLLWLRVTRPETFARVLHWMSIGEYLELRLFGHRRVSLSMASATGLFDQSTLSWDGLLLGTVGISPDHLSPLVDRGSPLRGLRPEFARRWPSLGDVPWLPAVGDGACANVGSGCIDPGCVALSLGTSGALRVLSPARRMETPLGLWCYRLDRRHALMGGAISNGGNVYRWMRERLRLPETGQLEARLVALPPDGHGLDLLPFLVGERSPDWPLSARGAITGLTLNTSPEEILLAALEAVAYRLALIRQLLRVPFPEAGAVVASGGALHHLPIWTRTLADVFGEPVLLSTEREASSRGAALLALEAIGAVESVSEAPRPSGRTFTPDPDRHARYAEAIHRHRSLDLLLSAGARGGEALPGYV